MSQNKYSILVVEDNRANQLLIKQQLQYLGYDADVVSNGELALKSLASGKFNLLMTDINMPEMDGYQLTQHIRTANDDRFSLIPIIAITANATEDDEQRCLSAGMDGFVSKPIELNYLQNYLRAFQQNGNQTGRLKNALSIDSGQPGDLGKDVVVAQENLLFDVSVVSDFVGDNPQMVKKLLNVFLEQAPETIAQIHTDCSKNDIKNVVNGCHKLKSSARSVGANRFSDLCVEMERAGKAGELAEIKALEQRLDVLFNETQAAIVSLGLS